MHIDRPWRLKLFRVWMAALLACLVLQAVPVRAGAEELAPSLDSAVAPPAVQEVSAQDDAPQGTLTATTKADSIPSHGNVVLSITPDELQTACELGDMVTVSFLGKTLSLPLCDSYTDIDAGSPGLFVRWDTVVLAVNGGDFASTYGVAAKTVNPDGTFSWTLAGGADEVAFTIALEEKGGYLPEYIMRHLVYSDARTDYPRLTDEQFANFREVTTTGMGAHVLYRGASPIDPRHNRNTYMDAAIRKVGITHILNLVDSEARIGSFEGYDQSYYATVSHYEANMVIDFQQAENREKLAQGLRYLAQNQGVYLIHCLEGKDRTGFAVAVLECLMGASYDEVVADYMETYKNYYGVLPQEERYGAIAKNGIVAQLCAAFGVRDLAAADLAAEAREYLLELGLTEDEIGAIEFNLNPKPSYSVAFYANGHGVAPGAQQVLEGSTVVRPADPAETGYAFGGWYLDAGCTQPFDFAASITGDLTLFAKWEAVAPAPQTDPVTPASGGQAAPKNGGARPQGSTAGSGSATLPQTGEPANGLALLLACVGSVLATKGLLLRLSTGE